LLQHLYRKRPAVIASGKDLHSSDALAYDSVHACQSSGR
jgi:hypothetical protein